MKKLASERLEIGTLNEIELINESTDYVHAVKNILGTKHRVTFVKVANRGNRWPGYDGQYPVANSRAYDLLLQIDPAGNFRTVKIPGFKGEYVCLITPFHKHDS